MARTRRSLVGAIALTLLAAPLQAAVSIAPLTTFGTNGWLAPGSSSYLGTANNERGIAYGNGHLYLVSRTGGTSVRVLDPLTGADLNTPLSVSGVSGGTFALNQIGVGTDGAIYAANLTTQSTTTAFTVYKWANESSAPVVAYTGNAGLAGSRIGDSLAITGGGNSTRIALGYSNSPAVAGNNGYAIIDPAAGSATAVGFTGTPPSAGDFRLGITFTDSSHVIGTQAITGVLYRYSSFSGSTGSLISSPANSSVTPNNTGERLLAYAVVGGIPLLASQSVGDSHVSLYDLSNPSAPVYLTAGNNTTGVLTANGNQTGELAWNVAADGMSATLYAMSTNQGIQAFTVSAPEPASLALGLLTVPLVRRRR